MSADIDVRHEEIDEQQIFIDLPFHLRAEVAANLTKDLLKHSHVRGLLLPSVTNGIRAMLDARKR